MNVVMLPSVSGGIGHISRTSALARALVRLDPSVRVEYVLDADRLRPFNIDATMRMGFRPRLMPPRTRESRDSIVRACFGDADVIVDDASRYLVPYRQLLPRAAWVSIPMHPLGDELFTDWPYLAQTDAILWAYAPLVGLPEELGVVADKVVQTGPFLEVANVPDKAEARAKLRIGAGDEVVVYAPRGFPFGREFGHRVLGALYAAVEALRSSGRHQRLRLTLLAVNDPSELRGIEGVPAELPGWVEVKGVVTPAEALLHTQAADVLVGEGTSTMHEGAALRTPLVLVPGTIMEATLLAVRLGERKAAHVFKAGDPGPGVVGAGEIAAVTAGVPKLDADALAAAIDSALSEPDRRAGMIDRAHALVTGGGGVDAAARVVLDAARRHAARGRREAA